MSFENKTYADTLKWLLESCGAGVRYLVLRDLVGLTEDDPELSSARNTAYEEGPIASVLSAMDEKGYWVKPGAGYNPKFRSTVWSLILLAQLGASIKNDPRVAKACEYALTHTLSGGGQFSHNDFPSGTIDCLQGNMCWALLELGCDDPRLDKAFEWMARSVTGEGIAPKEDSQANMRYYAYKCAPDFACGANAGLACSWGGVKVMLALSRFPENKRTQLIQDAIQHGITFLFSVDPASARYPTRNGAKPNRTWWNFGFPVFYSTDLVQLVEILANLGYAHDPRLVQAISFIRNKQDAQGRWSLEHEYNEKTWVNFGVKHQTNPWVTWRILRLLKQIDAN